jgi:hypothetical protein
MDTFGALTLIAALPFVLPLLIVRRNWEVVPVMLRTDAFVPEIEYVGVTWKILPEWFRVAAAVTFRVGERSIIAPV